MTAISGTTKIYGIFADPIAQVKAPAAFNALIAERGADAVFVPFHVCADSFVEAVEGMQRLRNFAGFTLTIPHKEAAARLCTRLGPIARACGAVNAVRIGPDGDLVGETFDGVGMVAAIERRMALSCNSSVLLVGAGGAGRAIAFAIAEKGIARLRISNRSTARAEELAEAVRQHHPGLHVETGSASPEDFDVMINATSLGLGGDARLPFEPERTRPGSVVADVIMEPAISPVLAACRALGRPVVPGAEMLAHQVGLMADFLRIGIPPRLRTPPADFLPKTG